MQNPETEHNNLLAVARPVGNIAQLLRQDAEYLDKRAREGKSAFVDRASMPFYFERDLVGVPFVVVTMPTFGTLKEGQFGPREVARLGVSLLDLSVPGGRAFAPVIAQLSHRYLLNDLRNLTENELVGGHVWTLGHNPDYPLTPRGQYPITLKIYEFGVDKPEVVEADALPADGFTPRDDQRQGTYPLPSASQMDSARQRFGLGTSTTTPADMTHQSAPAQPTVPAWFQGSETGPDIRRKRGRPPTRGIE